MSVCGDINDVKKVQSKYDNVHVFDKCTSCRGLANCTILENKGREQGTWLHYVIENYYNLPDKIFFLPAPIHKYSRINKGLEGTRIGGEENFTLGFWNGVSLTPADLRPFRKWYEHNIKNWNPENKDFYGNGVMLTSRERITRKPLSFYKKLYEQVLRGGRDSEVGHYLERSMGAVF